MNKREYDDFDASRLAEEALDQAEELAVTADDDGGRRDLPAEVEIIGVRFREAGKIYYFDPQGVQCKNGQYVIVKTSRGSEIGRVAIPNSTVKSDNIVLPLRTLERIASQADVERHERNIELEKEAFRICSQKIKEHGLDMKLIDARYTFDNSKLLFNFTAEKRVDFRELVKDLAYVFRTRIELRQIGIRDEAKLLGGLGVCGRPFCCATFLSDFAQVSIKMAKEQNLSLNSSKISGTCGRLMCCLRFEHEVYEEEIKRMPPCDTKVKTPDGYGIVSEISPLTHLVKVKFIDKNDSVSIKAYDLADIKIADGTEDAGKIERDTSEKEQKKENAPEKTQKNEKREKFFKNRHRNRKKSSSTGGDGEKK